MTEPKAALIGTTTDADGNVIHHYSPGVLDGRNASVLFSPEPAAEVEALAVVAAAAKFGPAVLPVREESCRSCMYPLEATAAVDGGSGPTAGSISICANCGNVTAFIARAGQLERRPLDAMERSVVLRLPAVQAAQIAIATRAVLRAHPLGKLD